MVAMMARKRWDWVIVDRKESEDSGKGNGNEGRTWGESGAEITTERYKQVGDKEGVIAEKRQLCSEFFLREK